MTHECFTVNLGRIERSYPNSRMPQERKLLIQKAMRSLSDEAFGLVIDEVIANEASMPTLKTLQKYAEEYIRAAERAEQKRQEAWLSGRRLQGSACRYCDDVGLVSAYRRGISAQSFAFRCPDPECIAAKQRCNPRDIRWDTTIHSAEYEPCFFHDRPFAKSELALAPV
jgi:hypothetical protein